MIITFDLFGESDSIVVTAQVVSCPAEKQKEPEVRPRLPELALELVILED